MVFFLKPLFGILYELEETHGVSVVSPDCETALRASDFFLIPFERIDDGSLAILILI
jgi:hypothetical protein